MQVLAINGSPRKTAGVTYKMLETLLAGMQQAHATTEIIHLADYKIEHCRGCFACWAKTPGKCIIKDDMEELLQKFINADLVIFGTPLYFFSVTGLMKNFMDRLLPNAEPFFIESKKHPKLTTQASRYDKAKKILLVSPCGFPEIEHFAGLIETFCCWSRISEIEYLGEILRPAGELLIKDHALLKLLLIPYFHRLKKAGKQIIEQGHIDDDLKKSLEKDLLPGGAKKYREQANKYFANEIAKNN